jgi:hypothetical protein
MRPSNNQRRQLSSIIASFTEAKHGLDLKVSEKRLGHIKDEKLSRRQKRNEWLASQQKAKKKGKKAEAKSAMNSEKFRSMVASLDSYSSSDLETSRMNTK